MAKRTCKPIKEGSTWSIRSRSNGVDLYFTGLKTSADATQKLHDARARIGARGKPAKLGPFKTTLAQALQDYARERLPFLKGAAQEATRWGCSSKSRARPAWPAMTVIQTMEIIAAIIEQPVSVIEKILTHLGLQARAPPRAPARGSQLQAP